MVRKKLSEMTPVERADRLMKGTTWDEAEQIGVEILARCMALHVYARKEGTEYMEKLMLKLLLKTTNRADEWAHENNNPALLALAAMGNELEKKQKERERKGNDTQRID